MSKPPHIMSVEFEDNKDLIIPAIENYQKQRIISPMYKEVLRWVRLNLFRIDSNPRYATFQLFLLYSCPQLIKYQELLWEELYLYEGQDIPPKTKDDQN